MERQNFCYLVSSMFSHSRIMAHNEPYLHVILSTQFCFVLFFYRSVLTGLFPQYRLNTIFEDMERVISRWCSIAIGILAKLRLQVGFGKACLETSIFIWPVFTGCAGTHWLRTCPPLSGLSPKRTSAFCWSPLHCSFHLSVIFFACYVTGPSFTIDVHFPGSRRWDKFPWYEQRISTRRCRVLVKLQNHRYGWCEIFQTRFKY